MADVEFTNENSVLWITLNRPEQMGAMTSAMRDEIIERLLAARTDLSVRCVVLTGKGKGFCTGADLSRPPGAPVPTEPPPIGATRETLKYGSQRLLPTGLTNRPGPGSGLGSGWAQEGRRRRWASGRGRASTR